MRNIGSRRELFVDDWLVEELRNLRFVMHCPVPQEIALQFDAPWEGESCAYATVFSDGTCCRMYYRGWSEKNDSDSVTAYAESPDGIHWTKPALGLFEDTRWPSNNIILVGDGTHNFVPFLDTNPHTEAESRYKALGSCPRFRRPGAPIEGALLPFTSTDAIRWQKLQDTPTITDGAFDSQNVVFWDQLRGMYVAFVRDFRHGCRTIRRSISLDFVHWSVPEWLDFGNTPDEHLYTSAICPYFRAPHMYLGFPKRFVPHRKLIDSHPDQGISDCVFISSRNGLHWDRRFMEAFIRPGLDREKWTDRNLQVAYGIIPTGPDQLSLYWIEHYKHATCRIRRGSLRLDGFVSLQASYQGGEVVTKPFIFQGKELVINVATSAVGSIQVEVQSPDQAAIAGYELSPAIYGDSIEHLVTWPRGSNLSTLTGKPIRLRFTMRDADLFSFQFRP